MRKKITPWLSTCKERVKSRETVPVANTGRRLYSSTIDLACVPGDLSGSVTLCNGALTCLRRGLVAFLPCAPDFSAWSHGGERSSQDRLRARMANDLRCLGVYWFSVKWDFRIWSKRVPDRIGVPPRTLPRALPLDPEVFGGMGQASGSWRTARRNCCCRTSSGVVDRERCATANT